MGKLVRLLPVFVLAAAAACASGPAPAPDPPASFEPVATFRSPSGGAEIVAAAPDGKLLIYTDPVARAVGFVDLGDIHAPRELGRVAVPGNPKSVAVALDGAWALVCAEARPSFLMVLDVRARSEIRRLPLGGQPDSIDISPDGRYAAIVIENQRDPAVDHERMPQPPPGWLTIVDLEGGPTRFTTRDVALIGLAERFPNDPEPEFVAIDARNRAAVTLQENNHVVIVDLPSGKVLTHWSAGATTHAADTRDDGRIAFDDRIVGARREPDGIAWTPGGLLITADEGDYDVDLAPGQFVGGRDFAVFSESGKLVFEPGATLEQEAARRGLYNDKRSDKRGIEPESVAVGMYGHRPFAFIVAERGDFLAVYKLDDEARPELLQLLRTGARPEGLLPLPARGLVVTANEGDGTLSIFALKSAS